MGFSRQEYWNGLSFPSPGDLPDLGIEPVYLALAVDSLPLSHQGNPTEVLPSPRNGVLAGWLGIFWSYLSSSEVSDHVGPFQPTKEDEVTHLIRPFCP